jgi:hypothetical protein
VELPLGVEMLLAWGSNYMHDKGSVHSSDVELLLQMHRVDERCHTKAEFEVAIAEFMVH